MKKQLLNEKQIRKMMKFANISALSDNFITKLNENEILDEMGAAHGGMPAAAPDDPELAGIVNQMGEDIYSEEQLQEQLDDLGLGDEEEGGEDLDAAGGDEGDEPLASAVTALKALKIGLEELDPEAAAAIQLDVESEEGEEDDAGAEDMDMDMMDMGGDEGDEGGDLGGGDLGGLEAAAGDEEELEESNIQLYERRLSPERRQKQIVSEVTRRVARRLLNAKRRLQ